MKNKSSEISHEINFLKTENYIFTYISFMAPLIIITLYSNFLGNDNTSTLYTEGLRNSSYYYGQYVNYRYISALIGYAIHYLGHSYFDFLPFWIILFSVSISFSAIETVKFLGFPLKYAPFLSLAITTSPFFTDLYLFAMVFSIYGISLMAIALSLYCCRKLNATSSIITTTICTIIVLTSYQPFVLILPFLGAVKLIKTSINRDRAILPAIVPVAGFLIGTLCFLVLIKLIGPDAGRNVNSFNALKNISDYIKELITIILYGKQPFETIYQTWFYIACLTITFILIFSTFLRDKSIVSTLAIVAFIAAILIYACPFALWGEFIWIDARMMAPSAYFLAACMILIYHVCPKKIQPILFLIGCLYITYSFYYQISLYAFFKGQDERDAVAVELIIKDIEKITKVSPDTKLSVVSTWENGIASHYRLSAFNTDWSRTEIFRVLSGNFIAAPKPQQACLGELHSSWQIERHDDTIVVCMK